MEIHYCDFLKVFTHTVPLCFLKKLRLLQPDFITARSSAYFLLMRFFCFIKDGIIVDPDCLIFPFDDAFIPYVVSDEGGFTGGELQARVRFERFMYMLLLSAPGICGGISRARECERFSVVVDECMDVGSRASM